MSTFLKRTLAVIAIAKVAGKVRQARAPKRSARGRIAPIAGIFALAGGIFYLTKTGRLQGLVERAKDITGDDSTAVLDDSLRSSGSGEASA